MQQKEKKSIVVMIRGRVDRKKDPNLLDFRAGIKF